MFGLGIDITGKLHVQRKLKLVILENTATTMYAFKNKCNERTGSPSVSFILPATSDKLNDCFFVAVTFYFMRTLIVCVFSVVLLQFRIGLRFLFNK